MGATAITRIGEGRSWPFLLGLAVRQATAEMVKGFSFVFWAFGTWWIPLLILLGVWRHVRRQWPPHLRAVALEHCLPSRHVQRGHVVIGQGGQPRVYDAA